MRTAFLLVCLAFLLAACSGGGDLRASLSGFPPDRQAFDRLPPLDAGIRARTVEAALEGPEDGKELFWKGLSGTSGGVQVLDTWVYGDTLLCRSVAERMIRAGETFPAEDMACWSGTEWVWLRETATPPTVLAPARSLPVYTARSTTNLAAVARATRTSRETLEKLNPLLVTARIRRGTTVFLPPKGSG
jgi:hypothetical protein